jgi:peptidoglycan hydrolase-like protein with peptidoglycan-binding domain
MKWFPIAAWVVFACLPAGGASSSSSHLHPKTAGRKPVTHRFARQIGRRPLSSASSREVRARVSSAETHASLRAASFRISAPAEREPQSSASSSGTASTSKKKKSSRKKKVAARRTPAQMNPTPDRVSDIQSALARSGYYKGDPNGKWDADTVDALQRFQSANGLDTNGKLDALTLQKLGLGSDVAGVSAPKGIVSHSCCSMTPSRSQGPRPSASTPIDSATSVASKPSSASGTDPSASESGQR